MSRTHRSLLSRESSREVTRSRLDTGVSGRSHSPPAGNMLSLKDLSQIPPQNPSRMSTMTTSKGMRSYPTTRLTPNRKTDTQGIRPELCFKEEPVGTSILRHSSETVPRWFFASKAKTFWGAGGHRRQLNLAKMSHFKTPPTPPPDPQETLIAHRVPPAPAPPVELPPLQDGAESRWHTLPMEGDLQKYMRWLGHENGRQGWFTRYVGPVVPGQYRAGGPIGRPRATQRL